MRKKTPDNLLKEKKMFIARHINESSKIDILTILGGLTLLSIVLFPMSDKKILLIWMVATGIVLLCRYLYVQSFRNSSNLTRERVEKYIVRSFASVIISGLCFGASGMALFPIDSVFYQIFLAGVIGCTAIISIGSTVPSLWIAFSYPLTMIVPVTLVSLKSTDTYHLYIGAVGVTCLIVHFLFSVKMNRFFNANLVLHLDNMDLTTELIQEVKKRIELENGSANISNA